MKSELARWSAAARSKGGQFPPTALGPDAANGKLLLAATLIGVGYWALAAAVTFGVLATATAPWPALFVGVALATIGTSLPTRYVGVYGRAWRDLRKARKGTPGETGG